MSYVYVTAYNIKKTLSYSEVDVNEIGNAIIRDVILTRDLYLSNLDSRKLKILYLFLESPNEFISKYFRGWKDTVRFLIEEPPAYHTNKNCEWFLKDFYNIEIPLKIKNKNLIKEARLWAKTNQELITPSTIDRFCFLFEEHFNRKYDANLVREDLKSIEKLNSGQQILNSKLESVELEIRKILESVDRRFLKKQQLFFEKNYREKNYKYNGEYRKSGAYIEHKLYWDLYFWRYPVIKPLNRSIQDYIFLKLNKDHKYSQNVLEFLKFRHCRAKDCN